MHSERGRKLVVERLEPNGTPTARGVAPGPHGSATDVSGRTDGAEAARPGPAAPLLTVSVVSHLQAGLIQALIAQIAALEAARIARGATALVARVVVTVNVDEPLPAELAPGAPFEIRVLRNARQQGFSRNHNQAFAACDTPLFVVMNPDLDLLDDPLPALAAAFDDPLLGLAVPRVLEIDGREADVARELPTPSSILRRTLGHRSPSPAPDWFAGVCMVIPAHVFRAVGGFDERFFMYCEDFDLCARTRLAGWRLAQVLDARMVHVAQRSSRRSLRPFLWHLNSLFKVWCSRTYRAYGARLRAC